MKKDKLKQALRYVLPLAVLLALAAVLLCVSRARTKKETAAQLTELYSGVRGAFRAETEKQWALLETVRSLPDADEAFFGAMAENWAFTDVFFLTEDGKYRTPGGEAGTLHADSAWDTEKNAIRTAQRGGEALTLFTLPASGERDGLHYELIALGYAPAEAWQLLNHELLSGRAETCIVGGDWAVLLSDVTGMPSGPDAALRTHTELSAAQLGQLRDEAKNGGSAVRALRWDGRKCYLVCCAAKDAEWAALGVVPKSAVGRSVRGLRIFSGILAWLTALLFLAAFLYVLISVRRDRDDRARKLDAAMAESDAKSALLAHMSHDIRTPVNAVVGLATLLDRDASEPGRVRAHTKSIQVSCRKLMELVTNVLDMNKIESGRMTVNSEEFDLRELAEELAARIRPQVNEREQHFTVHTEDMGNPGVFGDPAHLERILMNLLSNAVKYTHDGGEISLSVVQLAAEKVGCGRYRFTVTDNGAGMSEEYQKIIFEPFSKEENGLNGEGEGIGLGLSITKHLVDLLGGTIAVVSEPEQGSSFTVELDLLQQVRRMPETGQTAYSEPVNVFAGKRFLAAEDNVLNAEIIAELLEMKGAVCDIAENGRAAVEKFERSEAYTYDAVFMDVEMPEMNGYEAAAAIRQSVHMRARTVPIIAMTANATDDDVRDAMNAGMNAHIAKPVDMALVEKTLARLLR